MLRRLAAGLAAVGVIACGPALGRPATVPAKLVGVWGFAVATGDYCNPGTMHCAPGSGGSISLTLGADGAAELVVFESALLEGCGEIRTLLRKSGRVRVAGDIIAFTPTRGTYTAANGCRPDLSGTWTLEAGDLVPVSLRWRLPDPRDPAHETLEITDPGGEASGVYTRRRCPCPSSFETPATRAPQDEGQGLPLSNGWNYGTRQCWLRPSS